MLTVKYTENVLLFDYYIFYSIILFPSRRDPLLGGFQVNDMSHHPCVTPTYSVPLILVPSFSLSLSLPVWPECQWCQGASVCSVTTVIVKQRAQRGPLPWYSQRALGWGVLLYCITLSATPHLLLSPPSPQDIS